MIIARKVLRTDHLHAVLLREAMRSLKTLLGSKGSGDPAVIDIQRVGQHLLTEYVLNMAVSALAHADVTPLYEQYMDDPRLSDEDRDELARAYLLLQMTATQAPEAL